MREGKGLAEALKMNHSLTELLTRVSFQFCSKKNRMQKCSISPFHRQIHLEEKQKKKLKNV